MDRITIELYSTTVHGAIETVTVEAPKLTVWPEQFSPGALSLVADEDGPGRTVRMFAAGAWRSYELTRPTSKVDRGGLG